MSDVNGGLVSNPSDREMQGSMRGSSAHAAATDPNAWELSWVEPHAAKRDIGQLSNRKLIEPSASESRIPAYLAKTTGRVLEFLFLICSDALHESSCGDRSWWTFANWFYQLLGWEQDVFPFGSRAPEVRVPLPHYPPTYRLKGR